PSPTPSPQPPIRAPRGRSTGFAIELAVLAVGLLPLVGIGAASSRAPSLQALAATSIPAVLSIAWLGRRRVRFRKGARALLESQALLNAGSYQAGGECCQQILDNYRGYGGIEAPALSNLSISVHRQGDSARALEMLEVVERAGWCRPGSLLRAVVLQN